MTATECRRLAKLAASMGDADRAAYWTRRAAECAA